MKPLYYGILATAGLSLAAAGALAKDRFKEADANGDGKVTESELSAKNAELIANADTDGDGAVSEDEMRAYREAKRAQMREKRNPDKNKDGVIDRTEFIQAAQDRFDRMDENGDGVLSEDEQRRRRGRHHGRGRG